VVVELAADAVPGAKDILKPLGAKDVVEEDIDSSVADLFAGDEAPAPEPEPAASPTTT